ncbi:NAD(P)-dependent oxidoreductase [Acetobacter estunensis]|uniref:NAD-dependent epimerase/dehydratase family protein n=1 Tax=Acetobacter estunensis TaxID=104097 RepID=UPI001C2DECC8|nr:NAD(P)-dependent oxidoreductase [Acetobacter estunensis]MBV1837550.1 NAD(P)-dependent oxidoreductase [Acetobacter estunensis]
MKVFVAGASGALGRPLITRLLDAGHEVWGMAHRPESLAVIQSLGAHSVAGDALARDAMFTILGAIRPDAVIDQLTSLPRSPFDLPQRLPADRKLRLQGGENLLDAAHACDVQRYIQQSCGFYLDGGHVLVTEASPLKLLAPGHIGESARMYAELERRVLGTSSLQGIALRYGFFYGPGTWYWPDGAFSDHLHKGKVSIVGAGSSTFSFIHVDDAADATVTALTAPAGIYNVVDDQPTKLSEWLPAYAKWIGATAPHYLDEKEAFSLMGEESIYYQNNLDGACNQKAKEVLGFEPQRLPWMSDSR